MKKSYKVLGTHSLWLCAIALCAVIGFSLAGCASIPQHTVWGRADASGFQQFWTVDERNLGSLIWTGLSDSPMGPNVWTIDLRKVSGSPTMAYGMIFAAVNDNTYFDILINTTGRYIIRKRQDGGWTTIQPWTESPHLKTGYDQVNSIRVNRSGDTYTVLFNGEQALTFTDTTLQGGRRSSLAIYIGNATQESFPDIPVDVRFRLLY